MPREHREFSVDATGYEGTDDEDDDGSWPSPGLCLAAFTLGIVAGLILGLLLVYLR
jgi:hypothetical protein